MFVFSLMGNLLALSLNCKITLGRMTDVLQMEMLLWFLY